MTIPSLTPLPAAPNRATDPAGTFPTIANAFAAALPILGTELNAAIAQANIELGTVTGNVAAASASADAADASADAAQAAYAALVVGDASASSGTSASSVAIGTGTKNFTASTGRLWYTGMALILRSQANAANFMQGLVTSYDVATGALQVNVIVTGGAGTLTDWQIFPVAAAGSGGWTQIGSTIATTSGTTYTFTSIPQTYSDLLLVPEGMSSNSSTTLGLELSDNGSNWTTSFGLPVVDVVAADTLYGSIFIPGYRFPAGMATFGVGNLTANRSSSYIGTNAVTAGEWRIAAGVAAARLVWSAGAGDAGSLKLFGRT